MIEVAPLPNKVAPLKVTPPALLIVMSTGLIPPTAPVKVAVRVPKSIVRVPVLRMSSVVSNFTFPAREVMALTPEPKRAEPLNVTPPAPKIARLKLLSEPTFPEKVIPAVPEFIVACADPSVVLLKVIAPPELPTVVSRVEAPVKKTALRILLAGTEGSI